MTAVKTSSDESRPFFFIKLIHVVQYECKLLPNFMITLVLTSLKEKRNITSADHGISGLP